MRVFVCYRTRHLAEAETALQQLQIAADHALGILRQEEHLEQWQQKVKEKIALADMVLFLVGPDTFESPNLHWELKEAQDQEKRISIFQLPGVSEPASVPAEGVPCFAQAKAWYAYAHAAYTEDRTLRVDQYKMLMQSAEKVTDSRMKVNNLFFTITSSILSLSLLIGNAFEFSPAGMLVMLALTLLAFIISIFWTKLVRNYGKLNTGKFRLISQLEKQLYTNQSLREWEELTQTDIQYESNTQTEVQVVKYFRIFIVAMGVLEISYFIYLQQGH